MRSVAVRSLELKKKKKQAYSTTLRKRGELIFIFSILLQDSIGNRNIFRLYTCYIMMRIVINY